MNKFVNSPDYNMSYVVELANHYQIDLNKESHLLWIPRVLINLPLPHNWKKIREDLYQNSLETDMCLKFHPAEPFIQLYIKKARSFYKNNPEKLKGIPGL